MSASELPMDVNIKVKFTQQGDVAAFVNDMQRLKESSGSALSLNIEMADAAAGSAASLRRMALDVRLLSSGINTLTKNLDPFIPGIGAAGQAIVTAGAGFQVLISSASIAERYFAKGAVGMTQLKAGLSGLGTFLTSTAAGYATLGVAAVAFIGIPLAKAAWEATSGISAMQSEVKDLESALRDVNAEMRQFSTLGAEMGVESASLRALITSLEYAIEQGGDATCELTTKLEAAQREQSRLEVDSAHLAARTASIGYISTKTKNEVQDLNDEIAKLRETGMLGGLTANYRGAAAGYGAFPGGEARPTGGGGLGEGIQVAVNFPDAIFETAEGVREAIERGGLAVGNMLRNMEYDRRGLRSSE